jgi:hypothetical protein
MKARIIYGVYLMRKRGAYRAAELKELFPKEARTPAAHRDRHESRESEQLGAGRPR